MENNNSIFVQAKIEYTKQLINVLNPPIYEGINSIYEDAKEIYKSNSSTSILFIFRTLLEKIPEWNNELIVNETDRIIECSKCDWLDELVTAVYISHTKILMSIGNNNNNKINLTIPKLINFIHKCYINTAREIWKNPLLFSEDISGYEYQKNMNVIESIICDCIENTIRKSLPVKEILKDHLDIYDNKSSKPSKSNNGNKLLDELKELLMKNKNDDIIEGNNDNNEKTIELHGVDDDNDSNDSNDNNDDESKEDIKQNDNIIEYDSSKDDDSKKEKNEDIKSTSPGDSNRNKVYVNDSDYESPDEETINNKVENIEINDIPDITENVTEPIYDNPDIIDDPQKENDELYKKLIKINDENTDQEVSEPIKVSKIEDTPKSEQIIDIPDKPIDNPSDKLFEPILSVEESLLKEQEDRNYDKIFDITKEEEINELDESKLNGPKEQIIIDNVNNPGDNSNELVTVDKKDDDTETIDLFYNDLKEISDKKGLSMESVDENKYTLFDDL